MKQRNQSQLPSLLELRSLLELPSLLELSLLVFLPFPLLFLWCQCCPDLSLRVCSIHTGVTGRGGSPGGLFLSSCSLGAEPALPQLQPPVRELQGAARSQCLYHIGVHYCPALCSSPDSNLALECSCTVIINKEQGEKGLVLGLVLSLQVCWVLPGGSPAWCHWYCCDWTWPTTVTITSEGAQHTSGRTFWASKCSQKPGGHTW